MVFRLSPVRSSKRIANPFYRRSFYGIPKIAVDFVPIMMVRAFEGFLMKLTVFHHRSRKAIESL